MRPTLALAALLAASACKKEPDETTPTFPFTGPSDTADTAAPPAPKVPAEVRFRALIAWDPILGEVVPPVIDGSADYISAYIITLYEAGWSDADPTSTCDVVVQLDGYTVSPTARTEGFVWGIDIPSGAKDGYEDCTSNGWDTSEFPDGWKVEDWAGYGWSLRLYAPLSTELTDWLTPDNPTTGFDIYHYTGGDWWSDDAGVETDPDSNFWYGYALDAGHNVDFDARLDQRYDMVDATGNLTQGYYLFDQRVYWNAQ